MLVKSPPEFIEDGMKTVHTHPFDLTEYRTRLARTRAAMLARRIDLLVVTEPDDIEWLAGFQARTASPHFLIAEVDQTTMATTSVYRDCTTYTAGAPIQRELISLLTEREVCYEFIALQFSTATRAVTEPVRIALARAFHSVRWVDATHLVAWLRAVKTAAELHKLETASGWAEGALDAGAICCVRGATENNIIARMADKLMGAPSASARWPAVAPQVIIGSSSRGGAAVSSGRTVRGEYEGDDSGELVLLKCAASCDGYHTPAARTIFVGAQLPDCIRQAAVLVNKAINAQLAAMVNGAPAGVVFTAAKTVFDTSVLPVSCLGRAGNSVGLSSLPDASDCPLEVTAFCETPLATGMVLHLTPWLQTPWGAITLTATAVVGLRKGRVLGRPAASISRPDFNEVALRR
jgi:Xaa-Pro dipeptidase